MHIEIEREILLPALSTVGGVVERRHTLPILGNLLLQTQDERITVTATDMEVQITTSVAARIITPGASTVPARKFSDICRTLPDKALIEVKADETRVMVHSGRSRFQLSTLPAEEYPALLGHEVIDQPLLEKNPLITREAQSSESIGVDARLIMEQGALKRLLDKTAFAMAQQDVRHYLNGVLLELKQGEMRAVATDGHRLAKAHAALAALDDWQKTLQIIVPAKSVSELRRLLKSSDESAQLEFSERALVIRLGETTMITMLIDGRYPEYERVIPDHFDHHALVSREALRAALQRTAILSNEKFKGVRIVVTPGNPGLMTLESNNPEREEARDEIEIEFSGAETAIGFNISYLLDILGTIEGTTVEIAFNDGNSSARWLDPTGDGEIYIVMPMRL